MPPADIKGSMKPVLLLLLLPLGFLPLQGGVINHHGGFYVTGWDADGDQLDTGRGVGGKLDYRLLGMLFVEGRVGYVDFDDASVVPLEGSLNLKLPLPLTPYGGVGYGYYLTDGGGLENGSGVYAQLGATLELFGVGVFAEARLMDLEEDALDGASVHLGLSWKF